MYKVPVLYIVFNRPKETAISFEALRKIKPAKLYVAADGPRQNHPTDDANTKAVREIIGTIDWECEVKTLYQPENLGCRRAVESCLEWFFENEAQGVIIEDDIIPNKGFFTYSEIMLDRYKDDLNVLSINGCSLGYRNSKIPYGRTNYFNMWGWATWKRSVDVVKKTWSEFDPEASLENDPHIKKNLHLPVLFTDNSIWLKYWQKLFRNVYENKIDTWDYQWCYTVLKTNSFCIRPSQNFIINVGNGEQATHHKFNEAPIFNFVYTADDYSDKKIIPKIDYNYELFHVGAIVNSFYFRSFTKKYLQIYFSYKIEKIKSKFSK
jgi:hypothetical protein